MATLNVLNRAMKEAHDRGVVPRPLMSRWTQLWEDWQLACRALQSTEVRKEGLLDWWFAARSALLCAYAQIEQAVDR